MSGIPAYIIAMTAERLITLLLMKFLIQDVSENTFALWGQMISAVALLNVICMVRLDNGLLAILPKKSPKNIKYLFLISSAILTPVIAFFILAMTHFQNFAADLIFGNTANVNLIPPLIYFVVAEIIGYLGYSYFRIIKKFNLLALHYLLRFGGRSLLIIGLLGYTNTSLATATIYVALYTAVLGIIPLLWGTFNPINSRDSIKTIKSVFAQGGAQLVSAVTYWAVFNIDRYIVLHNVGIEALGKYLFLFGIAAPISLFPTIFAQSLVPKLVQYSAVNNKEFKRSYYQFVDVSFFLTIAGVFGFLAIFNEISILITANKFDTSHLELGLIATTLFLISLDALIGNYYLATSRSNIHAKFGILNLLLSLAGMLLLVGSFEIEGILIAKCVATIITTAFLIRKMGLIKYNLVFRRKYIRWLTSAIFMFFFLYTLNQNGIFVGGWFALLMTIITGATVYFCLNLYFIKNTLLPILLGRSLD